MDHVERFAELTFDESDFDPSLFVDRASSVLTVGDKRYHVIDWVLDEDDGKPVIHLSVTEIIDPLDL